MSTVKMAMKVYLTPETHHALMQRHPAYGEAGRVVKELIEAYVLRTKREPVDWAEVNRAADQVSKGQHNENE